MVYRVMEGYQTICRLGNCKGMSNVIQPSNPLIKFRHFAPISEESPLIMDQEGKVTVPGQH